MVNFMVLKLKLSKKNQHRPSIVNLNGKIVDGNDAKISIFDRGFLFGDSIFEVLMAQEGEIFFLESHIDRLWNSLQLTQMAPPLSRDELVKEIYKTLHGSKFKHSLIRIILTRGVGGPYMNPLPSFLFPNFYIIIHEAPEQPQWWIEKGVKIVTTAYPRPSNSPMQLAIKSSNALNSILAIIYANDPESQEVIVLNSAGQVTDCTCSHIWMVKNQVLMTPPLSVGILQGITRHNLINLIVNLQSRINFKEQNFSLQELYEADECFITSTTKGIIPVTKVDKQLIGSGRPGEITQNLLWTYRNFAFDSLRGNNRHKHT
jgi:branched-chain amino acid aminotransferase